MARQTLREQDAAGGAALASPLARVHVHRELNDIEYFAWCLGQPYNIVIEVQLSGPLRPEALRAALDKAQVRHPLLGVNTEPGPSHVPWFSSEGVGEIPLTVLEGAAPDAGVALLEQELVTPFVMDSAVQPRPPLIRVALLVPAEGPARASLLLTTHHLVADGMSLLFLVRDLLRFIAQPEAPFEIADAMVSPEDILPRAVRRRIPATPWRFNLVLSLTRLWAPLALRFRPHQAGAVSHHRKSWELTELQTERLLARCRREGVSVHAALCTACLPSFPAIHTAVNARGLLARPVGEAVGDVVDGAVVTLRYRRWASFWSNARRFHRHLRRQMRRTFRLFRLFSKAVPIERVAELGPLLVKLQGGKHPFGITNLGRLDDRAADLFAGEALRIESFFGGMTPKFDASAMSVYTVRGRMRINVLARESDDRAAEVRDGCDRAIARLIAAIDA